MAAAQGHYPHQMNFLEMVSLLVNMARPNDTDEGHNNFCYLINIFLSHFGGERFMVVGSTQEQTRLRTREDHGDYDYLLISEIVIPTTSLEYVDSLPLFVHINGIALQDKFPKLELVEGKYLPSSLLSECRPETFKQMRHVFQNASKFYLSDGTFFLDHKIKPGRSIEMYHKVECSELEKQRREPNKICRQILKQIQDSISQASVEDQNVLRNCLDLFQELKEKTDLVDTQHILCRSYGPIIAALAENSSDLPVNQTVTKEKTSAKRQELSDVDRSLLTDQISETVHESSGHLFAKPHSRDVSWTAIGDTETIEATTQKRANFEKNTHTLDCQGKFDNTLTCGQTSETVYKRKALCNKNETDFLPDVSMKYIKKSHFDYIPAFPLSGKPKFLKEWRNRDRRWPSKEIVDDIYESQFFLVAKPAMVRPSKPKDFCLSYNIAEIKLAKAMSQVQKKVLLILKALQKSYLHDYSHSLTSFHWKNVVYWVSERWESSFFIDTEEIVLSFLQNVLEYMTDCLCKQDLQHYFIPSNLFEGMDAEKAFQIIPKIVEIQENPTRSLRQFFIEENIVQPKFEAISRKSVKKFHSSYLDPVQNFETKEIISAFESFSLVDKQQGNLKEAFTDVALNFLPYWKEELERKHGNLWDINKTGQRCLDDIFNSFYTYLSIPKTERARSEEAKEQLIHDIWSMHPPSRMKCSRTRRKQNSK